MWHASRFNAPTFVRVLCVESYWRALMQLLRIGFAMCTHGTIFFSGWILSVPECFRDCVIWYLKFNHFKLQSASECIPFGCLSAIVSVRCYHEREWTAQIRPVLHGKLSVSEGGGLRSGSVYIRVVVNGACWPCFRWYLSPSVKIGRVCRLGNMCQPRGALPAVESLPMTHLWRETVDGYLWRVCLLTWTRRPSL